MTPLVPMKVNAQELVLTVTDLLVQCVSDN